jgi:hypothetical protein
MIYLALSVDFELFHNLHLMEQPDLTDPAIDFVGFRRRVFTALLYSGGFAL